MQKIHRHVSTKKTPQTKKIPGSKQVKMDSGGFGWKVDDWTQLDRFLVLGTEGGTYYVGEQELTIKNAEAVGRCIDANGIKTVERIVEISLEGRAPKNDPALFALAMCAKLGSAETKTAAYRALPKVARIGTHLFTFAEYCKAFGGLGGNGFKRAIARWYTERKADKLAYQAVKYQQRNGWSHRDLLRLAHPKAPTGDHQAVFEYIVKGRQNEMADGRKVPKDLKIIWAWEKAKTVEKLSEIVNLITDYRLPHECVPNQFKKSPEVWDALLQHMLPGAMLRNLNKLTVCGLLTGTSAATKKVREVLGSLEALKRARLHPMAILLALKTYQQGRGMRGNLTWSPVGQVVDALDGAFYLSFGTVTPTEKRLCLALDISGSMGCAVSGTPFLACREAVGALSLVTANVEPSYEMVAFTSGAPGEMSFKRGSNGGWGWGAGISQVDFSPRMRLDSVVRALAALPMGGTDCALPMRWALAKKVEIDTFVIYTDNESWAGDIHVDQALNDYRNKMGIPAKLVSVALAGGNFTVANPDDAGQMDVVGFDTATPNIISDFAMK
ncbi:MAG: TROVE domain-containing protein [Planctomycetota bacterium]|jgi:60 kDa SS-A/Ro ribonucleoprotein